MAGSRPPAWVAILVLGVFVLVFVDIEAVLRDREMRPPASTAF